MLERFPSSISGTKLVMRECLVDGDVMASSLAELLEVRARFMASYPDCTVEEYYEKAASQIRLISSIPIDVDVCLWFEDDLFCQVNLWFTAWLLKDHHQLSLVRPEDSLRYGFSGLDEAGLRKAHENGTDIPAEAMADFSKLWEYYQSEDMESLLTIGTKWQDDFPFLLPAIHAHRNRFPKDGSPGYPTALIEELIAELNTKSFGPVFQEFCRRTPIYGFGDLQVKRLFDDALKES